MRRYAVAVRTKEKALFIIVMALIILISAWLVMRLFKHQLLTIDALCFQP